MKKQMKKTTKILLLVVSGFILTIALFFTYLLWGMNRLIQTPIPTLNLMEVADGTYQGTYTNSRFTTKVQVEVVNHAIVQITILQQPKFLIEDDWLALQQRIVDEQSLAVDVISGGTATSNALLLAVYDALKPSE